MTESSVQQRFCGKCGEQARESASFCTSCGEPLSVPEQSADHAPESSPDDTGEGVDVAQNETTQAVLAIVFAESREECKRRVEEHRDVLLTDDADEVLSALIASNKENEATVESLEERRTLLARSRREGIDAAFAEFSQPPADTQSMHGANAKWNEALDAVAEFVNAPTWPACKLILKQNRKLLLTDTADEVLSALIANRRGDGDEDVRDLIAHRDLLMVSRQKGIGAAFAELLQDDKQPFLERARDWVIRLVIGIAVIVVLGMLFG